MPKTPPSSFDALILGGGLVGLTLAIQLAQNGLKIACFDRETPAVTLDKAFDGRTTAISYGSRLILEEAGIWKTLEKDSCPIRDIRIVNGKAPGFLHFDHKDVGSNAFGWIVENRLLRRALYEKAKDLKNLFHSAPVQVAKLEHTEARAIVTLLDGAIYSAPLLIAADGRRSMAREQAGIEIVQHDYDHDALVTVVGHEKPHDFVALEHFAATGPFASLPMTDDKGQHRSSLVWTVPRGQADQYLSLSTAEFDAELQQRFGKWLGRVQSITPRFRYPLGLQHAKSFYATRLALIGDAAHGIHPIAGQGLNLGLRDTKVLSDLIAEHQSLGLDIGSSILLEQYHKARLADSWSMAGATHSLDKLFSNNVASLGFLRQIGLGVVGHLPPLKNFFMRHAMGLTPLGVTKKKPPLGITKKSA